MQLALLAGGLATRLGSLTKNTPKSLIPIGNRPFIAHQFDLFKKNGIGEVVLCVGHLHEYIQEYVGDGTKFGLSVSYSVEPEQLGTAGALKHAAPLLDDSFFVMYGDSYLPTDFRSVRTFFDDTYAKAVMTVYKNADRYEPSNTAIQGWHVIAYDKENPQPSMQYIDYGLSLFKKEVLDIIPSPPSDLSDIVHALIVRNELFSYEVDQRFYEIGSLGGLASFEKYATQELRL